MQITKRQRLEAFKTGKAPPGLHFLVMARNTDGRVCAWGKAADQALAKETADRLWAKHQCYAGEERWIDQVELVLDTPVSRGIDAPPSEPCAAAENGMQPCDDDHHARGVACETCKERR